MISFQHEHAFVHTDPLWENYSGTVTRQQAFVVTPKSSDKSDVTQLKRHGEVIRALLAKCFAGPSPARLRSVGSAWSFSSVIQPGEVLLDTGNLSYTFRVEAQHLSPSYAPRAQQGFAPFYAEGGTGIASINARLGTEGLALQTSGGGDGHRIAGCISTGTHGSALHIGALHDTVLALHIVTSPDTAVLLQPAAAPLTSDLATWLEQKTGIPTQNVVSDALFHAAQVSLGSFGFIFGVILEAAPIYEFEIRRGRHRFEAQAVWDALESQDSSALNTEFQAPADHFDVIMLPYVDPNSDRSALFVTQMWKKPAPDVPFRVTNPAVPRRSADTIGIIGALAQDFAGPLTSGLVRKVVQAQIHGQLRGDSEPLKDRLFPGEVFGPTTLPGGMGASTELALNAKHTTKAVRKIYEVLESQGDKGRFLLGCIAVRFTKKTNALLGMNQYPTTCHIELPSIRNKDVLKVFAAVWEGLDQAGIPFACHWGQLGEFIPARTTAYYGAKAKAWTDARRQFLSDTAQRVFAAPMLKQAGL